MALESQGVLIRRASTSLATAASSVLSISSVSSVTVPGSSGKLYLLSNNTAVKDFGTLGFATGMRIKTNSTLSTGILTASSVVSSRITVYETATADTTTSLSFTGSSMNNIGEIVSFSGPTGVAAVIDITNLGSTAKQKLIGIRDEGNLTLEVNLETTAAALHMALKDDRAARAKRTFDIKLTDVGTSSTAQPTAMFFDGYVSGFSLTGAVDDVIKASIGLEISTEMHWITKVAS